MRQLGDDRGAPLRREAGPLFPVVEDRAMLATGVDGNVGWGAEVTDVDLDLPGGQKPEAAVGPAGVEVAKLGDGDVVEGRRGKGFLHGAFDEAIGEREAAGEG